MTNSNSDLGVLASEIIDGAKPSVQGSHAAVKEEKSRAKQDRFKRLAEARTIKAMKAIRLIGNLTGANYESTPEQREKISLALHNAVGEVEDKLSRIIKAETLSFTL